MWAKPPQLRVRSSQPTYFGIFWLPLNLLVSSLKWSKRWRISASPLCFKMLQVFTLCPMVPAKSCRAKTAPKDSSSPDGFCLRTITHTMMHCRSQQPTAERSERFQKKLIKAKWYRKGMKESIRVCSVCGWIRVHEYPTQSAVTESGPTPHESKQIAVHILEYVIPWRWLVWRAASSQLQTPEMRKACRVGLANVGIEYTGHLLLGYKLPSSWLRSNSFKRTMKGCRSLGQMISQANQVWYAQSNPMILIMNGEVNCKLAGKFNRSELFRLSILEHRWTGLFMTIHIFPGWWFLLSFGSGMSRHRRTPSSPYNATTIYQNEKRSQPRVRKQTSMACHSIVAKIEHESMKTLGRASVAKPPTLLTCKPHPSS